MNKHILVVSILVMAVLLMSCASKRLVKKGTELEQAGMTKEAAAYYYRALLKNSDNVDAKVSLKRAGQVKLDGMLHDFSKAYERSQTQKAVKLYNKARAYHNKVAREGVNLLFPEKYDSYYREVKNKHLERKYKEGYKLLQREHFGKAESVFREIKALDPGYKNVDELFTEAQNEPLYREAKEAMQAEKYRTAYDLYDEILRNAGSYKSAENLKAKALQEGEVTIALLPFSGYQAGSQIHREIMAEIESELTHLSNPFIKIIDRSHTRRIIHNHNIDFTSISSAQSTSRAGQLVGAKAFLHGNIIDIRKTPGELKKEDRKGYLKEEYKVKDAATGKPITKTRFKKVTYREYERENHAECTLIFKLIASETGEILASDKISAAAEDKVHYAKFDGDSDKLVPGYWKYKNRSSERDEIQDSFFRRSSLQSLFNNRTAIKPMEELTDEAIEKAARQIARNINSYNPE